jgi:hypothetical protein
MLGQKIRANISLLHIVRRSEPSVVFITLRGSRWVAENLANIDQPPVILLVLPLQSISPNVNDESLSFSYCFLRSSLGGGRHSDRFEGLDNWDG